MGPGDILTTLALPKAFHTFLSLRAQNQIRQKLFVHETLFSHDPLLMIFLKFWFNNHNATNNHEPTTQTPRLEFTSTFVLFPNPVVLPPAPPLDNYYNE